MKFIITNLATATIRERWIYEADSEAQAREMFEDGDEERELINDEIVGDESNRQLQTIEVAPGSRWSIEPQRDDNGPGLSSVAGTYFVRCDEDKATQWAVFERKGADFELVEDYPTRVAAQAAVDALEAGEPLPTPIWDNPVPVRTRMTYWIATVESDDDIHASEVVWGDWENADDAFGALSSYVTDAAANLAMPITWYGPLTLPNPA